METDIYKTPLSNTDDQDSVSNRRSILLWLCFAYLLVVSGLQAFGIVKFLRSPEGSSMSLMLWTVMAIFTPIGIKIASAINLVYLQKITIPLLLTTIVLVLVFYFFSPLSFQTGNFSIRHGISHPPLMNIVDWVILACITYYALYINKKGHLK